jgi:hypothetical protein
MQWSACRVGGWAGLHCPIRGRDMAASDVPCATLPLGSYRAVRALHALVQPCRPAGPHAVPRHATEARCVKFALEALPHAALKQAPCAPTVPLPCLLLPPHPSATAIAAAGAGVFGVEMFLLPDGSLLLNEVAPRPHNSGHYTIEACATSQYEAHLRAILGWPLGDPSMVAGAAIMLNVLGEADGEEGMRAAHELMGRAYKVGMEREGMGVGCVGGGRGGWMVAGGLHGWG